MLNVSMLDDAIRASGKSYTYLAEKLGISAQNFRLKRKGILEFKLSEVKILCAEIGITSASNMKKIFGLL